MRRFWVNIGGKVETECFCWALLIISCIYFPGFSSEGNFDVLTNAEQFLIPCGNLNFFSIEWLSSVNLLAPPSTSHSVPEFFVRQVWGESTPMTRLRQVLTKPSSFRVMVTANFHILLHIAAQEEHYHIAASTWCLCLNSSICRPCTMKQMWSSRCWWVARQLLQCNHRQKHRYNW